MYHVHKALQLLQSYLNSFGVAVLLPASSSPRPGGDAQTTFEHLLNGTSKRIAFRLLSNSWICYSSLQTYYRLRKSGHSKDCNRLKSMLWINSLAGIWGALDFFIALWHLTSL